MNVSYLSLGSNLGDRISYLRDACAMLNSDGEISGVSSVYETEPWGFHHENGFLNLVVEYKTLLNPDDLLKLCLQTEKLLGRKREGEGYQARIIDIDVLLFNDMILTSDHLKIPHPFMHERNFVLFPLAEIAPGIIHPILKLPVEQIKKNCKDSSMIMVYSSADSIDLLP